MPITLLIGIRASFFLHSGFARRHSLLPQVSMGSHLVIAQSSPC
ncbi:hypothetical protein [Shewanella sp. Isolate11]|nr:hypothetical protein [Shewanella sp. Isolate11]